MDYEQKYEDLLTEFEQYRKESIKWGLEDFLSLEVEGYNITREQAQEALEWMIRKHDCNDGITWGTVEYYYQEFGTEVN